MAENIFTDHDYQCTRNLAHVRLQNSVVTDNVAAASEITSKLLTLASETSKLWSVNCLNKLPLLDAFLLYAV